jgi:hypothetical protein
MHDHHGDPTGYLVRGIELPLPVRYTGNRLSSGSGGPKERATEHATRLLPGIARLSRRFLGRFLKKR